ncbi:hypothetical protein FMN50_11615 [Rhodobacterales bacterium]|nr:hypothetical protein FMN50_11615 [Rhodobacterales bacterium]
MNGLKNEIEEASARVAHLRIKAERPGSRLEDEFALEKARNRLLTLELRQMKRGGGEPKSPTRPVTANTFSKRTKSEYRIGSARERAEVAFKALQDGKVRLEERKKGDS